jgi:hypothetical protein
MTSVEQQLENLEQRLKVLEAEHEILRTLNQYGHAWDYGPDEARLDCFTDDGVFHLRPQALVPLEPFSCHGKDEIWDKWVSHHIMIPENYFKHVLIEPNITLLGDAEARVDSMLALFFHRDGSPYLCSFGRYRDHMVKCPDGRWRLKERIAELEAQDMPPGGWGNRTPPPKKGG